MEKQSIYAGNPDYMTQAEARHYLGDLCALTFLRHASLLGIKGVREGRCTYYPTADIENMKDLQDNAVERAIRLIKQRTGCTDVKIIF